MAPHLGRKHGELRVRGALARGQQEYLGARVHEHRLAEFAWKARTWVRHDAGRWCPLDSTQQYALETAAPQRVARLFSWASQVQPSPTGGNLRYQTKLTLAMGS